MQLTVRFIHPAKLAFVLKLRDRSLSPHHSKIKLVSAVKSLQIN